MRVTNSVSDVSHDSFLELDPLIRLVTKNIDDRKHNLNQADQNQPILGVSRLFQGS